MAGVTKYTEQMADKICEAIASETVSLKSICKREGFPAQSTVYKWLAEQPSFSEKYARAREMQADLMAEEILEIADSVENDTINTPDGQYANHEWINRSRLRVDARKWLASKLLPKKYGDKIDHTSDGKKIETTSPEMLAMIASKINQNAAS